jgi:hypothetical protein
MNERACDIFVRVIIRDDWNSELTNGNTFGFTTITILDNILRPIFYLKHDVSETGFRLRGPIRKSYSPSPDSSNNACKVYKANQWDSSCEGKNLCLIGGLSQHCHLTIAVCHVLQRRNTLRHATLARIWRRSLHAKGNHERPLCRFDPEADVKRRSVQRTARRKLCWGGGGLSCEFTAIGKNVYLYRTALKSVQTSDLCVFFEKLII